MLLLIGSLATGLVAQEKAEETREEVATMKIGRQAIEWHPAVEYERMTLVVSGGGAVREEVFEAGRNPRLALRDEKGNPLPDGSYRYEIKVVPKLDAGTREKLAAAREAGEVGMAERLRREGVLPRGPSSQSGSFTLREGAVVDPRLEEPGALHGKPTDPHVKVGGDMTIWGDLSVRGTKSFATLDPEDPGRAIFFGALEGPEVGTYFRGSAKLSGGEAVVELPEYFAKVTDERHLTVQLTPIGAWSRLYVAVKSVHRLVIRVAEGGDDAAFDFLVQGVRRGYVDFEVVRDSAAHRLEFPEVP